MIHCNTQWGSRQFEHWLGGRSCRLWEEKKERKKEIKSSYLLLKNRKFCAYFHKEMPQISLPLHKNRHRWLCSSCVCERLGNLMLTIIVIAVKRRRKKCDVNWELLQLKYLNGKNMKRALNTRRKERKGCESVFCLILQRTYTHPRVKKALLCIFLSNAKLI